MTWRAWVRAVAMALVLLLLWASAYGVVRWRIAVALEEESRARMEMALIHRMLEAGRDVDEIRKALENFDRRYGAENHKDRKKERQGPR